MNITPAMQQYYDIKDKHKEAIVFFRMGDFYEMFEEDARIAHTVLGISLTTRNKNADTPIMLAGIPYHAKDKYLPRLIEAGYKVAIVEQVSDPKAKGIVEREVVRVVTPATISLEGEGYSSLSESNILLSIVENEGGYAISVIDSVNHSWTCSEFSNMEDAAGALYKMRPVEVVLDKALFGDANIQELLEQKYGLNIYYYDFKAKPYKYLVETFSTKNLEAFGIEKRPGAQKAASMLHSYLCENQKSYKNALTSISYENRDNYMSLDPATIRSLDLVYNYYTASRTEGTVFGAINKTKTAMGKRFLYHSLLHPLQDLKEIQKRQTIIEAWSKEPILLDKVLQELKKIGDIEALLARIKHKRAGAQELLSLKKNLIAVRNIRDLIEKSENLTIIQSFI